MSKNFFANVAEQSAIIFLMTLVSIIIVVILGLSINFDKNQLHFQPSCTEMDPTFFFFESEWFVIAFSYLHTSVSQVNNRMVLSFEPFLKVLWAKYVHVPACYLFDHDMRSRHTQCWLEMIFWRSWIFKVHGCAERTLLLLTLFAIHCSSASKLQCSAWQIFGAQPFPF